MNLVTKACRLCRSAGPHETIAVREMMFGTREVFDYFICVECGSLQILDDLEEKELARYYPPEYYSYNMSAQPRIVQWLTTKYDRFELNTGRGLTGACIAALPASVRAAIGDTVTVIAQLAAEPDMRVLDVGCGGGGLLDRLAQAGFTHLSGADPLLEADGMTAQGVPLMKRYLHEVTGEFDLIMFNHSHEHVPELAATLSDALSKLAAGGICLVRLPTTSSEAWTTYGANWFQIDAPRHVVVPSRRGMALVADAVGLRVVETVDDSRLDQFIFSEAYKRDIAMNELKSLRQLLRIFGPRQIWGFGKRADQLNQARQGDQTGFVLRAK